MKDTFSSWKKFISSSDRETIFLSKRMPNRGSREEITLLVGERIKRNSEQEILSLRKKRKKEN